jgi:hypothetical protein
MAVGFAARFDAAADVSFQKRVAEAAAEAAINIYSEGAVPLHVARAALATAVLNDPPVSMVWVAPPIAPAKRTYAFALALATQGLDKDSSDSEIANGVASVWNALAGA